MASKKKSVSRKPARSKAKKVKAAPRIRKDLLKEYQETIKESDKQGHRVVEALTLADDDCLANVRTHISTLSLELDRLFNGKGIPTGRVVEIYGPPHIGKSTLLDHCFASVQQMGGVAVLADTEGARDSNYTQKIGVDLNTLQYLEFGQDSMHIENIITKIFETVEFWRAKAPEMPVLIGWDALGGTATRDELEKRLTKEARMAGASKVLRAACRQLPTKLGNTNISIVIINHEYEKINVNFGKKKDTYGGGALRHLASIRAQLYSTGYIKNGAGEILGREVVAKLVKNRLGNPWGEAKFALISGVGIDNVWSVFNRLYEAKIIVKSGSWAAINLDGDELKFQGWSGLVVKCQEDPTLFPRLVSVYLSLK